MLKLTIGGVESFDDETNSFVTVGGTPLELEHSLISLSLWESKWKKPFLDDRTEKTDEETLDYVRCMTLTPDVPENVYEQLDDTSLQKIVEYIQDAQTATTFHHQGNKKGGPKEKLTSELIYYWMVALTIPFECQYWHLNRLLTLVQVCTLKNQPAKKMSRAEQIAQMRELNAKRRQEMGSTG